MDERWNGGGHWDKKRRRLSSSQSDENLLDNMQSTRCCAEINSLNDTEISLLQVFCSYEGIDTCFLIETIEGIHCAAGIWRHGDLSADCCEQLMTFCNLLEGV